LQTGRTKVVINYRVRPHAAVTVYRDLGNHPGERIIAPAVQEAFKSRGGALYGRGIDFETRHSPPRYKSTRCGKEWLGTGLVIDEFSIASFNFSKTFDEAIEAKPRLSN
jgi:hypothetical protein